MDSTGEDWQLAWDGGSWRWYYKSTSNASSWTKPPGCALELPPQAPKGAVKHDELPEGWKTAWDNNRSKLYFFKDGCAPQWERPAGSPRQAVVQNDAASPEAAPSPEAARRGDQPLVSSPHSATTVASTPSKSDSRPAEATQAQGPLWDPAWCGRRKRWYYKDRNSKRAEWERPEGCTFEQFPQNPPEVPEGYSAAWHPQKQRFWYFDINTHESVGWNPPGAASPNAKRPASPDAKPFVQKEVKGNAEETPLPQGWAKAWNEKHKRYYYYNTALNKTQWIPPDRSELLGNGATVSSSSRSSPQDAASALPEGWQEAMDEKRKRVYYFNKSLGKTQWERPTSNTAEPLPVPRSKEVSDGSKESAHVEMAAGASNVPPQSQISSAAESEKDKSNTKSSPAEEAAAPKSTGEASAPKSSSEPAAAPAAQNEAREAASPRQAACSSAAPKFDASNQQLDRFQLNLLLEQHLDPDRFKNLGQVVNFFWKTQKSDTTTFDAFYDFLQKHG